MAIELDESGGEVVAVKLLDGTTARVKVDMWEADAAYGRLFREHAADLPERPADGPTTAEERAANEAIMRGWRDWLAAKGFPADLTVTTAAEIYAALRQKKEPPSGGPPSPGSTAASTPAPSKRKTSGRSKR